MTKRIIVRIDDVGIAGPNKSRDDGMVFYSKMHALMVERSIPHCPCIIPAECGPKECDWIHKNMTGNDLVCGCIHGWDHVSSGHTMVDDEFGGLNAKEKNGRIYLAKSYLHEETGIDVFGMSAPFNRYDDDVIKACFLAGTRYFLAGYGREKLESFIESNGVWVIPVESCLYRRSGDKGEVAHFVEDIEPRQFPYVLTLHTTWESTQIGDGTLECLLDVVVPFAYDVRNVDRDYGKGGE